MIAGVQLPVREDRKDFSISDLGTEFGVTARALRFYEDEAQREVTILRCEERIAQLEAQKHDIEEAIAEPAGLVDRLEAPLG